MIALGVLHSPTGYTSGYASWGGTTLTSSKVTLPLLGTVRGKVRGKVRVVLKAGILDLALALIMRSHAGLIVRH